MTVEGITVVLIDPQGRVTASASDFDESGVAGFTKREAQTLRAKRLCAVDYVVSACNGYVAAVIREGLGATELVRKLVEDQGFRMHVIEHGYDTTEASK